MAKIVKGLLGLIGLLVIIAVIAIVVVANNLGGIIKSGINDHGASVVGVPVSVSDVAINFLDGSASISDLHVGNPEGFSQSNAFELKRIDVELDLMSLTQPVVIIKRISIDVRYMEPIFQVSHILDLRIVKQLCVLAWCQVALLLSFTQLRCTTLGVVDPPKEGFWRETVPGESSATRPRRPTTTTDGPLKTVGILSQYQCEVRIKVLRLDM